MRALIVESGHLLTVEMQRPGDVAFYILPGGGQHHGETLVESLRRECGEELGFAPIVHGIAFIREYIGRHHEFARYHRQFHQLEVVFHCEIPATVRVHEGWETDRHQIGFRWLPLDRLAEHNFYPRALASFWDGARFDFPKVYLGDVN